MRSAAGASGPWRKRWKHWGGRGASDFGAASAEMEIPLNRFVEQVRYQRWLVILVATRPRDKAVRTVPELGVSCLDEDWSL